MEKMQMQDEAYKTFVEWLRLSGAYIPESAKLMPLMKSCYRPEEARLLTGMPLTATNLKDLASLKRMEAGDLAPILDGMAKRGLVFRSAWEDKITYRLNSLRFVFLRSFFWPGRRDEYTRNVAGHVSQYYRDGFGDHWKDVRTKGLRALPIRRTVEDPRRIVPYEDVMEVLKQQERFAVAHCACRHRAKMDAAAPECQHETENCLHFGKLADYIVYNELGRKITMGEAEAILTRSAEAGLVHAVSNWQRDVDTICNCCECCCVYFQAFHILKHKRSMSPSGFEIHTNLETCAGCGLCVKRCPMKALRLEAHPGARNKTGKVSLSTPGLCIGCGVCAYKCPTESLTLNRRPDVVEPPKDVSDLRMRYAEELSAAWAEQGKSPSKKPRLGDVSSGDPSSAA
jgi:electron transport complex protein RnfB